MQSAAPRYFIINKPYNMVSQFVSPDKVELLGQLDFNFPQGIHAVGRLDHHSEGLLILTTNKRLTRLLFSSRVPHKRTYLVQVNNELSEPHLLQLREGVTITIKDGLPYTTPPCEVCRVPDPTLLYPMAVTPPLYGPHSWLTITLTEGKFHQVRKMVQAVRHRCKRLIRISIEDLTLQHLPPGGVKEMEEREIFKLLQLNFPDENSSAQ